MNLSLFSDRLLEFFYARFDLVEAFYEVFESNKRQEDAESDQQKTREKVRLKSGGRRFKCEGDKKEEDDQKKILKAVEEP